MENEKYEEIINSIIECDQLLEELKAYVMELNSADEGSRKPPHPRWKPESGKPYYTINMGCACTGLTTWASDNLDGGIYSLGFVFKTEAEVEFAVERLKVLAEMREWAGNWRDCYALGYDGCASPGHEIIYIQPFYPCGEMRFASKEDVENCVKAVGADRIKKYYLGISEDQDGTQT